MNFVVIEQVLKNAEKVKIIFILLVAITLLNFICFLALSLFRSGFNYRKRIIFIPIMISDFLFICSLSIFSGMNWGLPVCFLALGVFLSTILFCIRVKSVDKRNKKKQKDSAKNFARMLDQSVSQNTPQDLSLDEEDLEHINVEKNLNDGRKEKIIDRRKVSEIDFSHVKNVMEKMNYYPLTPSEKKIITDLETSISIAENEGADTSLKSRINDGLGALLKIMSKYGI